MHPSSDEPAIESYTMPLRLAMESQQDELRYRERRDSSSLTRPLTDT